MVFPFTDVTSESMQEQLLDRFLKQVGQRVLPSCSDNSSELDASRMSSEKNSRKEPLSRTEGPLTDERLSAPERGEESTSDSSRVRTKDGFAVDDVLETQGPLGTLLSAVEDARDNDVAVEESSDSELVCQYGFEGMDSSGESSFEDGGFRSEEKKSRGDAVLHSLTDTDEAWRASGELPLKSPVVKEGGADRGRGDKGQGDLVNFFCAIDETKFVDKEASMDDDISEDIIENVEMSDCEDLPVKGSSSVKGVKDSSLNGNQEGLLSQVKHDFLFLYKNVPIYLYNSDRVESTSSLFSGISFVITGIRGLENNEPWPDQLKRLIRKNGGKILNFRTEPRRRNGNYLAGNSSQLALPRAILVSGRPQRTLKYIYALAQGVPCVHYQWILNSLTYGTTQPLFPYFLPAGYTPTGQLVQLPEWFMLEDQSEVSLLQRHPFASVSSNGDSCDLARIEVSGINEFKQQWKSILKYAGAMTVHRVGGFDSLSRRVDYILSDSNPKPYILSWVKQKQVPLCSTEWAVQTLIQRKIQDPNSHKSYRIHVDEEGW